MNRHQENAAAYVRKEKPETDTGKEKQNTTLINFRVL